MDTGAQTTLYVLAFLIGVIAGLRVLTAPAAVSCAAALGRLHFADPWLSFFGATATPYILCLLAIGELINDKLPKTPSRKALPSFALRLIVGALCGGALGSSAGALIAGAVLGVLGALAGTLGGYEFRMWLALKIGKDLPAALVEDAIAVIGAIAIVSQFP